MLYTYIIYYVINTVIIYLEFITYVLLQDIISIHILFVIITLTWPHLEGMLGHQVPS